VPGGHHNNTVDSIVLQNTHLLDHVSKVVSVPYCSSHSLHLEVVSTL